MMNTPQMFKAGIAILNKNSPAILTAFGAVGVVTTSVLTAKATIEAMEKIQEEQVEVNMRMGVNTPLTRQQKIKLVWPLYIEATVSGVLSCGAIVMSHRISSRRAAVIAAAYALNESKLEEYQDKIKEKFGVKKEAEARAEIAQDRINEAWDNDEVIFSPLDGKVCIQEEYTGRFFWSTREVVDNAVNQINAEIIKEGSVRMSEFYDLLAISHTSHSDHFGWTREERLEISWNTGVTPDGSIPVHTFEYVEGPVMNPERAFR